MKGSAEFGKRLRKFATALKKGRGKDAAPAARTTIAEELVLAILRQNATDTEAARAFDRLMASIVDLNELRVTTAGDLIEVLDGHISQATEKARQITMVLQALFDRENSLDLAYLRDKSIRDARQILDLLDGMTPFVSAMIVQRCLGGHAIPVDESIEALLKHQELVDPEAGMPEIAAFLERHVKSADARWFTQALRAEAVALRKRRAASSEARRRPAPSVSKRSASAGRSTPAKHAGANPSRSAPRPGRSTAKRSGPGKVGGRRR